MGKNKSVLNKQNHHHTSIRIILAQLPTKAMPPLPHKPAPPTSVTQQPPPPPSLCSGPERPVTPQCHRHRFSVNRGLCSTQNGPISRKSQGYTSPF